MWHNWVVLGLWMSFNGVMTDNRGMHDMPEYEVERWSTNQLRELGRKGHTYTVRNADDFNAVVTTAYVWDDDVVQLHNWVDPAERTNVVNALLAAAKGEDR